MTRIVVGTHVDRPVRRELRGIDRDVSADRVDLRRQLMHGLQDARDVRCT